MTAAGRVTLASVPDATVPDATVPDFTVPGRRPARPVVVVVGDVLLDRDVDGTVTRLAPDAPVPVVDVTHVRQSPGGAGLAALLCARRADVVLVTPLADDADGRELRHQLRDVALVGLGHEGPTRRKTRVRSAGQNLVRVDDGGPGTPADVTASTALVRDVLARCDAVLVADYGGGVSRDPALRDLLAEAAGRVPLVWDPHPRGGAPVPGAALVTPSAAEAERAAADLPGPPAGTDAAAAAGALRRAWDAEAVCVTAGEQGAFVATRSGDAADDDGPDDAADDDGPDDGLPGPVRHVPAPPVPGADPCGAGDCFAAAAVVGLAERTNVGTDAGTDARSTDASGTDVTAAEVMDAVQEAVAAASAWVASGGADGFRRARESGAAPAAPAPEVSLAELGARLRADGGTLVATSGCFDLLHAGHVSLLSAARRLGDHLVVLLNSDSSVRRLKGPERPVVPLEDRARVLEGLACVDAVVVLDDDEPSAAVAALRPDVWAKGGDYTWHDLPEAAVVHAYGGRVVTVPRLRGRSTTGLVSRVRESEPVGPVRAATPTATTRRSS
ncbi:PfkB family carbohydrate kinase [Promicromonospora thailandica]|uniref:RfaE bifunctional protein, domain II n=1 Tax=Promicromonospora thailandica TaxID=765201 RepID=A0A9X2G5U2_9MICO|nr:PfkB family carbohydrate kinase [Promicromonospora thailandica]MCP2263066.1 rfaE bifunctional protein, domain II [Promicromonospora thailandica]BFF18441.1 PfkB family carbohydrate kinase [Promicromonospora thailandica]